MACARGFLVLFIVVLASAPPAAAQQTASAETVIAAYLLNFARFTQWPSEVLTPAAPLELCVADDAVRAALERAAEGRTVDGRRLEVRHVAPAGPVQGCALLFIGRAESDSLRSVLSTIAGASILTVSDAEDFASRGGIVQLYLEEGRMRFAIHLGNARAARLTLSAQLLNLARVIGK